MMGSVETKPGSTRKKKQNRKEVPFTKEHSNHGRGKAWRMLTALLKEAEVSNKP